MAANSKVQDAVIDDLGTLLDAGKGALLIMVASDTRLAVHRSVLSARSPVFERMFHHETLEDGSSQVDIPNVEGPVLRQLMAYCYSLHMPQLPSMAPHLLVPADKYRLLGLKAQCEQMMCEHLTVENVADMAVLAMRYSCQSLRQAVATFMKGYTSLVLKTQSWAAALLSNPDLDVELTSLIAEPPAEFRILSSEEKGRRLVKAAEDGRVEEVEALLAVGTDAGAWHYCGITALHYAAQGGHVEVARRLVAGGAQVEACERWRRRPLHWAAHCGRTAVLRLLLASAADPNARDVYGKTPLHYAARRDRAEMAAALLEAGANRAARDNSGRTPLDIANRGNRQHIIQLLTSTTPTE